MKFCRDCKYYNEYNIFCWSPQNPISLVTGRVAQQDPYLSRENEKLCGSQGVFWQSKQEQHFGVEE